MAPKLLVVEVQLRNENFALGSHFSHLNRVADLLQNLTELFLRGRLVPWLWLGRRSVDARLPQKHCLVNKLFVVGCGRPWDIPHGSLKVRAQGDVDIPDNPAEYAFG